MKAKNILRFIFLWPFSFLWETVYRIRRAFYEYGILKKAYFRVPIVSVGNITFGGTGKTPFIIWLSEYFHEKTLVPAVLTRGYRGNLESGTGLIKSGQTFRSNPVDYGDEPLLISRRMKSGAVIVGKKRAKNLKRFFDEIQPDIVLLDDGFQHLQLSRKFNIVLFDATFPIERYKVAPLGYLREGLSALKDADAIVLSRCDQVSEQRVRALLDYLVPYHHPKVPISQIKYVPTGLSNTYYKKVMSIEELQNKNVVATAAIASPGAFFHFIEKLGANVVERISYPDHHYFTSEDVNDLLEKASYHDSILVVSEKDMVKIRRVSQDSRILCLNIDIEFMKGEEELIEALSDSLHLKRYNAYSAPVTI